VKHALAELGYPAVYLDARGVADAMDLAMRIADAAVLTLRPMAAAWWLSDDVPFDVEGLRLTRTLSVQGVSLEELRDGAGRPSARLREALQLVPALAEGVVLLAIDHFDSMLENLSARVAEELLAVIRAEWQASPSTELLLVGRPHGRLIKALHDPQAAMYQAGQSLHMRRAAPARVVEDLVLARPWTDLPASVVGEAARLAEGAPAILWRVLDAITGGDHDQQSAQSAWERLVNANAPMAAQQFELSGGVHRVAPTVVAALSRGLGPYETPLNPKSVRDALNRLRQRGIVWSPEKGRWRIADPLLSAWARTHAPSWVDRRARRRS
jgi:hypothetical protein